MAGSESSEDEKWQFSTTIKESKRYSACWDMVLPRPKGTFDANALREEHIFTTDLLVSHLQTGTKREEIQDYLRRSGPSRGAIAAATSQEFPFMFYVVETHDAELLQHVINLGGNVNSSRRFEGRYSIPLSVHAIINQAPARRACTDVILTLLSNGASCDCIPSWYYQSLAELPTELAPAQSMELNSYSKRWCRSSLTRLLFDLGINLTDRYYIRKTLNLSRRARDLQVVDLHSAQGLFRLPFMVVGQDLAAQRLTQALIDCMLDDHKGPRVFLFAGPSGHGKTQMASKLGEALKLDHFKVDCTNHKSSKDLFGIERQFDKGTDSKGLNTFIANNDGKAAIIEKTSPSVRNALLIPFREGTYRDRTTDGNVDCSRLIWVLASNVLDSKIMEFLDHPLYSQVLLGDRFEPVARQKVYERLAFLLEQEAMSDAVFGKPFTGRITEFIPFLPFTPIERLVGVHTYIADFAKRVRRPVVVRGRGDRDNLLLGNVELRVNDAYATCKHLSQTYYSKDIGMPSLERAVTRTVERSVKQEYRAISSDIEETDELLVIRTNFEDDKVVARIVRDEVKENGHVL